MKKRLGFILGACLIVACATALTACGDSNNCSHNFRSEWFTDATHHWQQCSVCEEKGCYEAHNYNIENESEEYLKAPASTTSKATYYKSCVCGAKGTDTFERGKLLGEIQNLSMSSSDITYGDDYSVVYTTKGDVTVEYKRRGDDDVTYSKIKPTSVGVYTARVTLAETDIQDSYSQTIDFDINPKEIKNLQISFEYNGQSYREIDISHIEDGLSLQIAFDSPNVGAVATGVYVYLNGEDTLNYEVVTLGADAWNVAIVPKELEINWVAPWSLQFKNSGYNFEPEVQFENLEINDDCVAVIELNSGDNYWYDSAFTYKITGLSGLSIDNYKLPTENLISPEYTITCDGEATIHTPIELQDISLYGGNCMNSIFMKLHIENGGGFKFKYDLESLGARYNIAILKYGVIGDESFVRSVQFVTGDDSTGEYSDTFSLSAGDYYIELSKYDCETVWGVDTIALYYSYEN